MAGFSFELRMKGARVLMANTCPAHAQQKSVGEGDGGLGMTGCVRGGGGGAAGAVALSA